MSGGTYTYDLVDLTRVAGGLTTLAAAFGDASAHRQDADGALGYPDLRGAVRGFVDNWTHERGKQIEAIQGSAEALGRIIDGYEEYDVSSADELRESCAP